MCGIAGVVSRDPEALGAVRGMTDALRHRGPDDEGYLLAAADGTSVAAFAGRDTLGALGLPPMPRRPPAGVEVALGHRRLSIIDVGPGGHGPMASADGRAWVTYNGEIYNYLELREELRALGHSFRTSSDTEVLLAAYDQWGPDALARFNGMWAFALVDTRRGILLAARDRFGVKPFHYYADDRLFAFASEIKGLLAHPGVRARADEKTVLGFLVRGALDEGASTFFEGIRALPASHRLILDIRTRRLEVERWYDLPPAGTRRADPMRLRELLRDAVRLRLRSDVDVGTCLSGGLDSSSIVALTASLRTETTGGRRRAFSVTYTDAGLDESAFIDAVVAATGVDAARTTATAADLWHDLPALIRHQDEPIPSPGPYSHWRVMALAHQAGMKVLLDGQGADEILAGYHYQYGPYLAEIAARRGLGAAWREAAAAHRVTGRPLGFFLGLLAYHRLPLPPAARRWALERFTTHGYLPARLLDPAVTARLGAPPGERHQPQPTLAAERMADLWRTSLPALLRYEDRNSMAFGIEARTPFLDYRLVEEAMALDAEDLIRGGWTKAVLREAMAGLVPEPVRLRRDKLGFPTPESRWLGELAPRVRELLGAKTARVAGFLDPSGFQRWLSVPDPILARRRGLWRLLCVELWIRSLEEPRRHAEVRSA